MLKKMINLANKLDEKKMFREASLIDSLIEKISSIDSSKEMAKDDELPDYYKVPDMDTLKDDDSPKFESILKKHSEKAYGDLDLGDVIADIGVGLGSGYGDLQDFAYGLNNYGEDLVSELKEKELIDETTDVFDFRDEFQMEIFGYIGARAILKDMLENLKDEEHRKYLKTIEAILETIIKDLDFNFDFGPLSSYIK